MVCGYLNPDGVLCFQHWVHVTVQKLQMASTGGEPAGAPGIYRSAGYFLIPIHPGTLAVQVVFVDVAEDRRRYRNGGIAEPELFADIGGRFG